MRCVAVVLALGLILVGTPACGRSGPGKGLWVDRERLAAIPAEGPAWEALRKVAEAEAGTPDLSDKGDRVNVRVLAKALVYARTGDPELRQEVVAACRAAIGTEGETTLALGRELAGWPRSGTRSWRAGI
jgi:hypothetical protein